MDAIIKPIEKMKPFFDKVARNKYLKAIKDGFISSMPIILFSSIFLLIAYVPNVFGFYWSKEIETIIMKPYNYSMGILAIAVAATTTKHFTDTLNREMPANNQINSISTMICAICGFLILSSDALEGGFASEFMGSKGLLTAFMTAFVVGGIYKFCIKRNITIKMPEQVPPAVSQSFNLLLPIMIVLAVTGVLNFIFNNITSDGIQVLIYNMIQAPLTSLGSSMGTIIVFVVVQQFLWVLGIHGPNTLNALRSVIFTEQQNMNLAYVAAHGTAWGAPYPINWGSINDAFGNTGGSGATLGLIIATFIVGKKNKAQYQICKMSLAPGLFNINEPIIFGLPLVMNPMYIVPFILSPVVCNIIGWFCVCVIKIIPPVAYSVAWTTPGFLIPFLGSGANNIMALVIGFVCVGVSTLIYLPFVIASTKAALKAEGAENA